MNTSASKQNSSDTASITLLPIELVVGIFSQLESFSEVLALNATCRKLRAIWIENAKQIANVIAPRSIECDKYARQVLAAKSGIDPNKLSAGNAIDLVRYARHLEEAVAQFNSLVVRQIPERK